MLALNLVVAILLLLFLITILKVHPFVSLLCVSFWVGLFAGMPLTQITESIQTGFGNTLGFIGIVLGLGTMLGKLLEESGGAERIARTLISLLGPKRVHWAIYIVSFIVGVPVFFQVGFVLLIPLVFTITKELKIPALRVGLPMLAGLSVVHGILPPHPAALQCLGIYQADIGKTIILGILVGVPASILAGPIFATLLAPRLMNMEAIKIAEESIQKKKHGVLPSFFTTMFTIFLPVILLLLATYADIALPKGSQIYMILKFLGSPSTALLISVLLAFYTFGLSRKMSLGQIQKHCDSSLLLIASILVILGAGGAFSKVLVDSGVGKYVADFAKDINLNPIVFGWFVATLIRVATGSATVAMTTAAGIVAPLVKNSGVSPELMVLSTGGGALMLSHVNDSGFWLIKEYFRMSLKETFLSWTLLETILGTSVLLLTLLMEKILTLW